MIRIKTVVKFSEGLHARPASQLVSVCKKSKSSIKLIKGDRKSDPKSILGILSLGVMPNDEIEIEIDGEDETMTSEALVAFFEV